MDKIHIKANSESEEIVTELPAESGYDISAKKIQFQAPCPAKISESRYKIGIANEGFIRNLQNEEGHIYITEQAIENAVDKSQFTGATYFIDHDDIKGTDKKSHQTAWDYAGIITSEWHEQKNGKLVLMGELLLADTIAGKHAKQVIDHILYLQENNLPIPNIGNSPTVYPTTLERKNGEKTYLELIDFNKAKSLELVFFQANERAVFYERLSAQNPTETNMKNAELEKRTIEIEAVTNPTKTEPIKLSADDRTRLDAVDRLEKQAIRADQRALKAELSAITNEFGEEATALIRNKFSENESINWDTFEAEINQTRALMSAMSKSPVYGLTNPGGVNSGDGQQHTIRMGANPPITVTDPMDTLKASVLRMFHVDLKDVQDKNGKAMYSADTTTFNIELGELFRDLMGDFEGIGKFDIDAARRKTGLASISEGTLSELFCDCFNTAVLTCTQNLTRRATSAYNYWKKFTKVTKVSSFRKTRIRIEGGFSGFQHTEPGSPIRQLCDEILKDGEIGRWYHPAGYVEIPYQMLDNLEECGNFRMRPQKLATAAMLYKARLITRLLTDNNGFGTVLSDGDYLFHPKRGNIYTGSRAMLSVHSWSYARQVMFNASEDGSGAQLALEPYGVIINISNEHRAYQALSGMYAPGQLNTMLNPDSRVSADRITAAPEWQKPDHWLAYANMDICPPLMLNYRYQETPRIWTESGGTQSTGYFERGVFRWAARDDFELVVAEPRAMIKFLPS